MTQKEIHEYSKFVKEYYEALGRLNDQYMFDETLTNEEYLRQKKQIEVTYLRSIYNPEK